MPTTGHHESTMYRYYRALPETVVISESRHVRTSHDAFDWVEDIGQATKDHLDETNETRRKLKEQHDLNTDLVVITESKLWRTRYAVGLRRAS